MISDDYSQTIRDKLVGTYVIMKEAKPAGHGHRTFGQFGFVGLMLTCPVVVPRRDRE